MVTWNNLDTLTSYAKLKDLKDHVDIKEAMTGIFCAYGFWFKL